MKTEDSSRTLSKNGTSLLGNHLDVRKFGLLPSQGRRLHRLHLDGPLLPRRLLEVTFTTL